MLISDKRLDITSLSIHKALITGGCRSGKSDLALRLALQSEAPRAFIATMTGGEASRKMGFPEDPEIEARILAHRAVRGEGWITFEEPLDPAEALSLAESRGCSCALLDCVTMWLSNLLMRDMSAWGDGDPTARSARILGQVHGLALKLGAIAIPVFIVTNETGMGIVPDTVLGRQFRDLQGTANRILAEACDTVLLTVCGLPMLLKGTEA